MKYESKYIAIDINRKNVFFLFFYIRLFSIILEVKFDKKAKELDVQAVPENPPSEIQPTLDLIDKIAESKKKSGTPDNIFSRDSVDSEAQSTLDLIDKIAASKKKHGDVVQDVSTENMEFETEVVYENKDRYSEPEYDEAHRKLKLTDFPGYESWVKPVPVVKRPKTKKKKKSKTTRSLRTK